MKTAPRFYLYPVPEAPHTLLFQVVRDLPVDDWMILSATVVAVADPVAAIYLRACFPERPLGRNGTEVLDPCEVWIEEDEREEAERLLREACPSPAAWFQVLQVAFDSEAARRARWRSGKAGAWWRPSPTRGSAAPPDGAQAGLRRAAAGHRPAGGGHGDGLER